MPARSGCGSPDWHLVAVVIAMTQRTSAWAGSSAIFATAAASIAAASAGAAATGTASAAAIASPCCYLVLILQHAYFDSTRIFG